MKIGLISDTHDHLPAEVFELFKGVDTVVHAGDIGREEIITDLRVLGPVHAVYGNVDRFPVVSHFKRIDFFKIEGIRFCLTHMIGTPKSFAFQLFKMNREVDIVIYGHTHQPEKKEYKGILFINPGSASHPRNTAYGSVAVLEIKDGKIDVEILKLTK